MILTRRTVTPGGYHSGQCSHRVAGSRWLTCTPHSCTLFFSLQDIPSFYRLQEKNNKTRSKSSSPSRAAGWHFPYQWQPWERHQFPKVMIQSRLLLAYPAGWWQRFPFCYWTWLIKQAKNSCHLYLVPLRFHSGTGCCLMAIADYCTSLKKYCNEVL